jgi:uncharacterized protein YhaN
MYISRFHVNGFGALFDFGIEELSDGLVVLCGPNEAGKSTLLDFITGVMFGFAQRRDNPRFHAPAKGGRHGGWIELAGAGGLHEQRWRIERYTGPPKQLDITGPNRSPASEDELRQALGGADEALFRAVFALDLNELNNTSAMTRDEVRELLFSASIVGQRRSAAHAMADLQKQRASLARARQGDARVNKLWAQLETVRSALSQAERETGEYARRERELEQIESEVAAARDRCEEIARRARDLELLTELWDVLKDKKAAEERLATWPEPTPLARWLEERQGELSSLNAACSGHLERVKQLADLRNQRAGIDQHIQAALASLGPSWDRERIAAASGWIDLTDQLQGFKVSLTDLEASFLAARAVCDQADSSVELAELEGADPDERMKDSANEPTAEDKAKLVSELRKNLAEQRRLAAQAVVEAHQTGARTGVARGTNLLVALAGAVIVALALGPVLVSNRALERVVCGVLAVVGCAVLTWVLVVLRRRSLAAAARPGSTEQAIENVTRRVGELATVLGLGATPSDSDVETAADKIEEERNEQRSLEEHKRQIAAALLRSEQAHQSLERASQALEVEQSDFSIWKRAHFLADSSSPEATLKSLETLQGAWEYLNALGRVDSRISQLSIEIGEFSERVTNLARDLERLGGDSTRLKSDLAGALGELCASVADVLDMQADKSSVVRSVAEAGARIERSLGLGERAEELHAELEGGQVLAWDQEKALVASQRQDAQGDLEHEVRAHQDASNELGELASSAKIAELDQTRLSLEQELDNTLKSWAQLGCARLLLERTLKRHEQERQPAVLARAGELFATVTHHRYERVLPSVGDDAASDALRVVSPSGTQIDAAELSRGSVEQLYLCLRIGLAETFAERAEPLPLVLDDVLVNFDPERAEHTAEVLAEIAENHQVLLFTCHPHLAELVGQVAPHAQFIELERL